MSLLIAVSRVAGLTVERKGIEARFAQPGDEAQRSVRAIDRTGGDLFDGGEQIVIIRMIRKRYRVVDRQPPARPVAVERRPDHRP